MLVIGITTVHGNVPFLVFWCAVVVGITVMNVWAAFANGGSLFTAESSGDEPPAQRSDRTGSRPES